MQLTLEVDSPKDLNLYFPVIGKRIRGRFDAQRRVTRNPDAARLLGEWPRPVPGQRLKLDTNTSTLTVEEPLHDAGNEDIVALFKKRGIEIPKTERHENVHVPSCLHIMKRAIDANMARVVEGKLPDKIEGAMLKSFITSNQPDETETLRQTVAENSALMREAIDAIQVLARAILKDKRE